MQLQLFVLCLRIRKHLLRVGKVAALKIYRYRYRYRGKSLFTYRLLTELKIPLPYISDQFTFGEMKTFRVVFPSLGLIS